MTRAAITPIVPGHHTHPYPRSILSPCSSSTTCPLRRHLRVPRSVFRRVYQAVKDEPFSQQRINATGRLQAHPLQKVVAAFRVIAYGEAAERADEYVRLSRSTVAQATKLCLEFIVRRWGPTNLRRPNNLELKKMMERNAERGFPGCMGSLDCTHWEWHQFPTGTAGAYQSRKGSEALLSRPSAMRTCGFGTCLSVPPGA